MKNLPKRIEFFLPKRPIPEATEPYNKYGKIRPHSIRCLQFDQKVRPLSTRKIFRPEKFDLFTATPIRSKAYTPMTRCMMYRFCVSLRNIPRNMTFGSLSVYFQSRKFWCSLGRERGQVLTCFVIVSCGYSNLRRFGTFSRIVSM